jgi:hypothetical protein
MAGWQWHRMPSMRNGRRIDMTDTISLSSPEIHETRKKLRELKPGRSLF